MDSRFPKYLRWIVDRLDFLQIPNLGLLLAGLAVLGFVGRNMLGAPMEQFMFHPVAVMQGEWWRLITFPVSEAPNNPIFLLFYCFYVYFIMNAMESEWGVAPVTVFTLFAYFCGLAGCFVVGQAMSIWIYVIENLSLAFGTLFPEIELALFGIIPVKAKWLAIFAGGLIFLQFVSGPWLFKLFLLIVLAPYLLFFGPVLVNAGISHYRLKQRRKRFDKDMWR